MCAKMFERVFVLFSSEISVNYRNSTQIGRQQSVANRKRKERKKKQQNWKEKLTEKMSINIDRIQMKRSALSICRLTVHLLVVRSIWRLNWPNTQRKSIHSNRKTGGSETKRWKNLFLFRWHCCLLLLGSHAIIAALHVQTIFNPCLCIHAISRIRTFGQWFCVRFECRKIFPGRCENVYANWSAMPTSTTK